MKSLNVFGALLAGLLSFSSDSPAVEPSGDILFKQAAAGQAHALAIKTDGTLWAWGWNSYGQLGDGTQTATNSPKQIGSGTDWKAVTAGHRHSLATKTDGTLWAWGWNSSGQLGNGNTNNSFVPIQIGSETNWRSVDGGANHTVAIKTDGTLWAWGWNIGQSYVTNIIVSPMQMGSATNWLSASAGYNHVVAIKTDGTLWAWGQNMYGQIGDGSRVLKASPVQIGSATNWLSASAGYAITEAVKTDGTLWAWGHGDSGQLGDGAWSDYYSPTRIGSATNWQCVAAGYYNAIAIRTDGTIWDSSGTYSRIGVATNWQSVWMSSDSGFLVVAIKPDDTLWTWGYNNFGQLGNGTNVTQYTPGKIGLPAFVAQPTNVASYLGMPASFNVTATGSQPLFYQWRKNGVNLADGGTISGATTPNLTLSNPQRADQAAYSVVVSNSFGSVTSMVAGFTIKDLSFGQLTAGNGHSLAVRADGTLWAWGYNYYGQLGNGTQTTTSFPVQAGSSTAWQSVAAGYDHTLAVKTDGTLWAWGYNGYSQLGDGTTVNKNAPVQVSSGTNWQSVAAGAYHSLAVRADGTLWAWGYNYYGQLGDGTTATRNAPAQIGSSADWRSVAAGSYHSVAVKWDGTLWSWGNNSSGQLGNGTQTATNRPVQIGADADWQSVAAGNSHTLAIKTDGTLWAWGSNGSGKLGDGSGVSKVSPVQIGSATHWHSVSAGAEHSVATKTDGTLWAWGYNGNGQLGDGTTANKSIPQQVGSQTDWQAVAAGGNFTVALKKDGTLWSWGYNGYGQLGNGTTEPSLIPLKQGSPAILVQPIYATNSAGTAIFTFTHSGSVPLYYKWFKNGTALVDGAGVSGSTNVALVISNLTLNLTDHYTVAVSNDYGRVISDPAQFVFNVDAFAPYADSSVYALARQDDGKIVVGGAFSTLAGVARTCIGRVNADGTLDASPNVTPTGYINALLMQPDGKILVGGDFKYLNGAAIKRIARLNADGSVDAFNPSINTQGSDYSSAKAIAVMTNGQILVGGTFNQISLVSRVNFGRVNANGSLDGSYVMHADNTVQCMTLQTDGKVLVGGLFTTLGGVARNRIARLNADGSLDYLFDPGVNGSVNTLAVQPDRKILVGGQFSTLAGGSRANIGRLNADGTLDDSFNPGANGPVNAIVMQPNGRILVGGAFSALGGQALYSLGLLNPDGSVDARFRPWISRQNGSFVKALALQPDKKVVVGGTFDTVDGIGRINLCRLAIPEPLLLIVQQPTSTTCAPGETVSFSATVEGEATLAYQWLKNGNPLTDGGRIAGSTSNILTLTDVLMADAGNYCLVITNKTGTLTSSVAALKVLMPFAPTNTTANPLPFGTVGREYSKVMTADGGVLPYAWTISDGNLPSGLSLSNDGVLSGAPEVRTNAQFTVRVTGNNGAYAEDTFSLVVFTAPVITTPNPLPFGKTGRAYSQTLTGIGGIMPYSWDVVAGSLPPGLVLNSSGILSGTPSVATNAAFSVQMTTANGVSSTNAFSLNIILETTLLVENFEHGGAIPAGWTQEYPSGAVPWVFQKGGNGSPVNSHGGIYNALLYGASGNCTRLVTRMIDFGTNTSAQLTFWLDMKTYIINQDTMSVYYKTSATAPWVFLKNYIYCPSWTQQTLDLPALSSTYYIAFEGYTYGGYGVCVDDVVITATTQPVPPTITTMALPSGTIGASYQTTLTATGGTTPYLWAVTSGSLPPGLSFNSAGAISGTPGQSGNFTFAAKVAGQDGLTSTNEFILAINPVSTTDNPTYVFTTFVGGYSGSADGTNDSARFRLPTGVCLDSSNNLFVADSWNHTIRKVTPAGVVTTFAGLAGVSGTNDGPSSVARFYNPMGLVADSSDQIFVADQYNNTIRRINTNGYVVTVAGRAGWSGYDATSGTYYLNHPTGITVGEDGNEYFVDTDFSTVIEMRGYTPPDEDLYLVAGWEDGYADGTGATAKFLWPKGIVFNQGDLFVADTGNSLIRKVTLGGVVTTLAGSPGVSGSADGTNTTARFNHLSAIAADSAGNLFVVDRDDHTIRRITQSGVVTTIGGCAGISGCRDDIGIAARFDSPQGIAVDEDGVLYIADTSNNRIVKGTPVAFLDPEYQLTVNNGAGSGSYTNGAVVSIAASNAPSGQIFDQWTGATQYVASVSSSSTTVTMPETNIAVTATYKPETWLLTVTNGTGSGAYTNGAVVAIEANAASSGQVFDVWTGATQVVASVTSAVTTVTMPAQAISVTATYKTVSSSPKAITGFRVTTANSGTLVNSPTWVTGKYGNALSFSNGKYVTVPAPAPDIFNITGDLTIALWANPNSVTCSGADPGFDLVAKRTSNSATPYELYIGNGGTLHLNYWATSIAYPIFTATTNITTGTWQHIAVTRSFSNSIATVKFYVNGIAAGTSTAASGPAKGSSAPVWLSRGPYHQTYTSQGTYSGLLDDVQIYNRALSAQEVSQVMANNSSFISNRVGNWKLDESSGTTASDTVADGYINEGAKTVTALVPAGTLVTALIPMITTSPQTTVSPLSGVAQNFSSPVVYTVTAADLSTQGYTVTVAVPTANSDADGNGLPDVWELECFGRICISPNTLCANGVNTVLEAFIAGIQPNDPQSRFMISNFRSLSEGKAFDWNTVSGRIYSVYWTTNLLDSFQPLETNIPWTRNSFTNSPLVPQGFYKINVELAE